MLLPLAQSQEQTRYAAGANDAHRILDAPRALAFWHLASLDAPTVAVVWALAFAWAGGIRLALWVPVLLALVTWSVYAGDRLLDARAGLRNPGRQLLRERHEFHWRFRRIFLPLAIFAACASAAIALAYMPAMARGRDSILAVAAFAYFSGVHGRRDAGHTGFDLPRRFLSKEFLVGILFTTGCILPAWPRIVSSDAADSPLWPFWICGAYFAALAWLNCSCIARWESEGIDTPLASRANESGCYFAAAFLAVAGGLAAVVAYPAHARAAALLATGALSALLLALLDRERMRFSALALRASADLALLAPLVLLLR